MKSKQLLIILICIWSTCFSEQNIEFNAQLINGTCQLNYYINRTDGIIIKQQEYESNLSHINMGFIDASLFILMSILNMIFQIALITFFIKYKKLRESPGDILVAISVCELFLAFHWLSSGLHYFVIGNVQNNTNFCQINSVISVYFNILEYIYNCAICVYFIYKTRRIINLKATKFEIIIRYIKTVYFHFFLFSLILVVVYILNESEYLGKSLSGTCSIIGISKLPFVGPIIWFFYVILSVFTLVYFKQKVPEIKNSKFMNLKKKSLISLYRYIISCTIIWFLITICNIMLSADCMHEHTTQTTESTNYVFISFNNILKIMNSITLTYLRYNDPNIQKGIKNFKKKLIKNRQRSQKDQYQIQNNMESSLLVSKLGFSDSLVQQMKVSLGFTLLASLGIYFRKRQPSLLEQRVADNIESMNENSTNQISYMVDPMNETIVNEQTDCIQVSNDILNHMKIPYASDLSVIAGSLTIYFPQTFQKIREDDKEMFFMEQSLDLNENMKNIQKSGQADGGRGGDWFLFTYDNQLIIKTMSNEDLDTTKKVISQYDSYIQLNKASLLVKMYGIFSLQTLNNEQQHFYLMNNMNHCNKKFIIAQYDLKGSLREVNENDQIDINPSNKEMESKRVLKEMNFINNEKMIHIDQVYQEKVINQLMKDTQFLMNLGIMDYSLYISKVDHYKMKQQMIKKNMFNELYLILTLEKQNEMMLKMNCVPSSDPNVYYHFGLIDYLQLFTTQRKIQKLTNVFSKASSCIEPPKYQEKFMKFMKQIFDQEQRM